MLEGVRAGGSISERWVPSARAHANVPRMDGKDSKALPSPGASSRLVHAALAGLLSCGVQACSSSHAEAHITSTANVGALTSADFQTLCDARDGRVEVMAHCGGLATGAGFSYDIDTQTIAEHTCKGANTCAGWNCITDH